jgi:hypothetical protein
VAGRGSRSVLRALFTALGAIAITTGQPHALFIGLLLVELIGPPLVVVWQARLSTTS